MATLRYGLSEVEMVLPSAPGAAASAIQWRAADRRLAGLTTRYDSLLDGEMIVRDGSYVPARYLTFEGAELTLEVEINADTVLGQVIPAQVAAVSLMTPDGVAGCIDTDDLGVFGLARPVSGRIRLTCTTPTADLSTDWISV